MAVCSRCNEQITFGPHPVSGKLSPFSLDGEIHFKKCRPETSEKRLELPLSKHQCKTCGAPGEYVFWSKIEGGERLRLAHACQHGGSFIEQNAFNIGLITHDEEDYWQEIVLRGLDKYGEYKKKIEKNFEHLSLDTECCGDKKSGVITIGSHNYLHLKKLEIVNGERGDVPVMHLWSEFDDNIRVIRIENIKGNLILSYTEKYKNDSPDDNPL
ncbi:MAG: hypothetical protein E6R04_08135 [Spirochaetes bacterium]|nr:MAG: hypothetical protein E6R04_08135 [Spirochaetota bacterium]